MRLKKYENLKNQYPEYISLDQLHKICRIAKRSALYLVQNNIIPAEDTGKKTWRYRIALEDVITYLRRREQLGSMIPCGAVMSRPKCSQNPRLSFASYVSQGEEHMVAEYFRYIYADYPDVLTMADTVEMTGFAKETIRRFIQSGDVEPLAITHKYHIPKQTLLSFVTSQKFTSCKSNSASFKKVLGGFEIWKAAR